MKNKLALIFLALVSFGLASCTQKEQVPDTKSTITISDAKLVIPADGGQASFEVASETAYAVYTEISWVKVVVDGTKVTVSAEANESLQSRYALVKVKNVKDEAELTIMQYSLHSSGFEPEDIEVSSDEATIVYEYSFDKPIVATASEPWVRLTITDESLTVNIAENTTLETKEDHFRTAEISWKLGADEGVIAVKQYNAEFMKVDPNWTVSFDGQVTVEGVQLDQISNAVALVGVSGQYYITYAPKSAIAEGQKMGDFVASLQPVIRDDLDFEILMYEIEYGEIISYNDLLFEKSGSKTFAPIAKGDYVAIAIGLNGNSENLDLTGHYAYKEFTVKGDEPGPGPSTDYESWLGKWKVKNGSKTDVWTVVEKAKGSTYTIKGLAGKTYEVEAVYDPATSAMVVYAQNNLGTATSSKYGDGVVGLYGMYNDGYFASPNDWSNPYEIFSCYYADGKANLIPADVTTDATYTIQNAYLIAEAADGSYFGVGDAGALPTTMEKDGQGGGGDDKPAYKAFLGEWEIPHGDGATTDTWTIAEKVAGSTYTITGIEGYSDLAVEAEFDAASGSIVVRAQEEVGVRTISGAECPVGFYGATAAGSFWRPGEQAYAIFTGSVSGDKITLEPSTVRTESGDVLPELALYIATVNGKYSLLKKFADATKLPNTLTRKSGQGGGDDPAGDITGKWICPKATDYWGDTYSDWAINIKASGKNYVIDDFDLGFDSFLAQYSLKAQPAPATLSGNTLVVPDNTLTGITGGGNPVVWRGVDSEDYYSDILFTVDLANNTISLASALFGAFDTDPSDPGWYSLYAAPVVFYKEGHVPSSVKACGTSVTADKAARRNFKSMSGKSFKVLSGEQFQPRMKALQAKSIVLKKRNTRTETVHPRASAAVNNVLTK